MNRMARWHEFVRVSVAAAFLVLALPATGAESAPDNAQKKEEEEELSEVQVTGTRIQLPNVTSANPVTSITAEEMQRLGFVNVADALTQLVPQNISTYMPSLVGDIQTSGAAELGLIGGAGSGSRDMDRGTFFVGNTIANLRGLDPMFGTRTLTMIDGRRVVSTSSQADVVDLNIIPSNMLERMDVVTGGASATYGSGAMAGVVNLVLARRRTGARLDVDYGVNEAGDGGSPHIALSDGFTMFSGKGHLLVGGEWQRTQPIQDCAAARDWCAEARALFQNSNGSLSNATAALTPLPGYENYPARFQVENLHFSQFSPNGVIYSNNTSTNLASPPPSAGYRFTESPGDNGLFGVEPFAYGYRGASSASSVMNGDGPLATTGTPLRSGNNRKSATANFEYDFTPTTTGYVQASYATTDNSNRNRYTTSTACARFNTPGVAAIAGAKVNKGQVIRFGPQGSDLFFDFATNAAVTQVSDAYWANSAFRTFLGASNQAGTTGTGTGTPPASLDAAGNSALNGTLTRRNAPWIIRPSDGTANNNTGGAFGSTLASPPSTYVFSSNVSEARWRLIRTGSTTGSAYWALDYIVLSQTAGPSGSEAAFDDPGVPAVAPSLGRNSYAFLTNLGPDALVQVQAANNRSPGTGTQNSATNSLFGTTPCAGFTAIRKVWNPQVQQRTTSESDTWRALAGVRGRFGSDWKWDAYYQYGTTDSTSRQFNGATNLSFNFAMDAVIDDRTTKVVDGETVSNLPAEGGTYGQPVCRIVRDGVPQFDTGGFPLSNPEDLAALAADCKPLNIFGNGSAFPMFTDADGNPTLTSAQAAELQRQALAYAFKDSISDGSTSLQTLSFNTSGTVWQGWAGPLAGAIGVEFTGNTVDNSGTRGDGGFYRKSDLSTWGDAYGGKTRSLEGYTELNLPLASGLDGLNLLSVNAAARYTSYYNKGGAGTTGDHATQNTLNWKFQAEFSPFDFVRFRLTRSRDLRAAGYRDLFLNQPSLPDQASGTNYWRQPTEVSDENRTERWGFVRVGNPDLKPEKSNTLTLGMVLRPGGWAQGMSITADYYNIRVKDGIYTPYNFSSAGTVAQTCWENSNNSDDPENPNYGLQLFDPDRPECQEITFATDENGERNLEDILYINATRPQNGLPYQRRGVDLSFNYNFPLSRAFESLPGSVSLTMRGSRALESSGLQQTCPTFGQSVSGTVQCTDGFTRIDAVGQIRTSTYIPGVAASPKWTGNITGSYLYGNLTTSLTARYVGAAFMDKTWTDDPDDSRYWAQDAAGNFLLDAKGQRRLSNASTDNNWVKPYVNFSLNGSYNLQVTNLKQFQLFGSINNLFGKSPPFTGGGISGANAGTNDTMGRAYRMGVRLQF